MNIYIYSSYYIYIYIYIYIYERETSVCMCYTIKVKQKTQRLFDEFLYSFNILYICIYKCAQSVYCQPFASEDLLRPACLLASLTLYGKEPVMFWMAPLAYQKKGILFCVLQSAWEGQGWKSNCRYYTLYYTLWLHSLYDYFVYTYYYTYFILTY